MSILLAKNRPPGHAPMLEGLSSPIDLDALDQVEVDSFTIFEGVENVSQFVLHSYIVWHDNKFWVMWSQGIGANDEDQDGQRVRYSTSADGETWSSPEWLSPAPTSGFRNIARGFWIRDGTLHGLYSLDEAGGLFGNSLELRSVSWSGSAWTGDQQIADNTINNFPPQRLASGEWIMSRRDSTTAVSIIRGDIGDWTIFSLSNPQALALSEPTLVFNGNTIVATFRCNSGDENNRLARSFSFDRGETWTPARLTNFPDARSKHHALRLSNGLWVLCSNPAYLRRREKMTLALSDDGYTFDRMLMLRGEPTTPQWSVSPVRAGYQYPHMIEHDGNLWIVYSTDKEAIEVSRVALADLAA